MELIVLKVLLNFNSTISFAGLGKIENSTLLNSVLESVVTNFVSKVLFFLQNGQIWRVNGG